MRCIVFGVLTLLIFVPLVNLQFVDVEQETEEHCIQKCKTQTHTDVTYCEDLQFCSFQCEEGCKLWKLSLNSSCQEVCNGTQMTFAPKELYCIIGCNDAVAYYFAELRLRLGTPPPPALVADSLTATSLRLEWNFPLARDTGLRYFLQYEERADAWEYCRNESWGPHDTVFVDNLQPYTKYRFRVVLILRNMTEPIVSPPSVVISTLPAGVPASPPVIVRAVPVDSTRISVSWEPGPFPHGPLLSYVLRITDNQPQGYSALKDLSPENKFYISKNLSPNRNYTFSISMRNGIGTGPSAKVSVATPPEPTVKNSETPVLILGAHHVVIEQGTNMLDEPVILYNTNEFINGLAIHVSKRLLFVSDSARYVHKMPLYKYTNHTTNTVILSPSQMNFVPMDLSMDWLNEHLYVLGEVSHISKVWQIARCTLEGNGLTVAVAGLQSKPHHIEVDPYNGYLFWVSKIGLYRLDLADISNGIKHEIRPDLILAETNLGAFIVDHTHFRLLVSNQNKSTVNSVSLDGKEVYNMRQKIIKSRLQKVVSLAAANKKFYWTDGKDVLFEEYHPSSDNSLYFHNSYPLGLSKSYIKVLVNLTSSQPVPVPVNPPTHVQAIFGANIAKTSWQSPHLLGGQGKGAWQNWSYEISIKDLKTHNIRLIRDINSTSYTIRDLDENTEYVIKTAAYTSFGKGPWSTEFIGRTLKVNKGASQPVIFWSAVEGLLKSDASGENVDTIIHSSSSIGSNFSDISWYEDQLYLVTNTSQLFWYNMTSHLHGTLSDVDSVRSVAVDWIGKKLYWSNPKQQMIIRGNLNGTQKEHLKLNTVAKELNIDSINGYLYWSTGHTLECARLNGAEHFKYHESQMFSGLHIMGLTLDMDHNQIYWIVRGPDRSDLFRAPMAGSVINPLENITESRLKVSNLTGPLHYFNNRLIWLQNDKSAMISDLEGRYTASISGKSLFSLNMVSVMDNSLHILPKPSKLSSLQGIFVIPESIDKLSVRVIGSWDCFNITWKPVQNINYGVVFYEIKIDSSFRNDSIITTTYPSINYSSNITPYTKLQISLRAYTYWGTSPYIKLKIYSPPSTPSAPRNLRAYTNHNADKVNVTFRWDTPLVTNGVLEGYKISWWYIGHNRTVNDSTIIESSDKEFVLHNLEKNIKCYFQVTAFTEAGDGETSNVIEIKTNNENPIPILLVASSDSIYIKDIDMNQNYTILHGISTPLLISYLKRERKVFWINDLQELLMVNLANSNRSKLIDLNGSAMSLTIDWIERSIYYIQIDEMQGSLLYKLNLNHVEKGIVRSALIYRTPNMISKIEISPFTRKLYWVESDSTFRVNHLMQANSDGSNRTALFLEDRQNCNCPIRPNVEKSFSIDYSITKTKPEIIFVDLHDENIMISDEDGCNCRVYANNTLISDHLPLQNLCSDFAYLYWMNQSNGLMYLLHKEKKTLLRLPMNFEKFLVYGSHMQPYPEEQCLTPTIKDNLVVSLHKQSSNALTLKMPKYQIHESCGNVSIATIEYTVYYMPYNDDGVSCDKSCTKLTTFQEFLEIKNLRSFSNYSFAIALSNYYTDHNQIKIGPGIVFQTAAGAPSPPRNVEAIVLDPTLVRITWLPPKELNGDYVRYKIHWSTEKSLTGIKHTGEQIVMETELNIYSVLLDKLSPNETYSIWVQAYSQSNESSIPSEKQIIKTYPDPDNITLVSATALELVINWNISEEIQSYNIQYALLASNDWISIQPDYFSINMKSDEENRNQSYIISYLKTKAQYKFRLILKYRKNDSFYVWPKDSRFTFETLGDRPSPPGVPIIQHVNNDIYQVWWEASKDNGALIDVYMLETLKTPNYRSKRSTNRTAWYSSAPSVEEPEYEWESIYNGTETYWKINGLSEDYRYAFRVSSMNVYGWSDYSEESIQFDLSSAAKLAEKQDLSYLIVAIVVPLTVVIVFGISLKFCKLCCSKKKKDTHIKAATRGPDLELATLRELPRRINFRQNTNVLYVSTIPAGDESAMPHIQRNQITLTKFLGSGAFGEVFEGKAKGINGNAETKVAVKTLRKGASEQEKSEFLQEAQLMSHFKHEHILRLLGVCLDNDPQFIIMELMEGGDLLTYLRSSRKSTINSEALTLFDLLKMCVDVANGCKYLEEMHFVHRDLACRNCLVSSTDPQSRIVKIGDFGLARDIYKNDYYRKEGEGLLPVRWMAPESLVDGVFTCQSDVWAFGVLLWEIMTLGQQPYPARNNLEVLHYVRRGGRLGKPIDCPEALHDLMLNCWSYEPEQRPTFKYCLDVLEKSYYDNVNSPMTGVHVGQYISTVPQHMDGISNQAYFQDENHNHSGTSWKSEESNRELTPFLPPENQPTEIPKYLELVYDSDCPIENDGYEIPRTTLDNIIKLDPNPENENDILESSESDRLNKVVNDLTSIECLLKDVDYTNMNPNEQNICKK